MAEPGRHLDGRQAGQQESLSMGMSEAVECHSWAKSSMTPFVS